MSPRSPARQFLGRPGNIGLGSAGKPLMGSSCPLLSAVRMVLRQAKATLMAMIILHFAHRNKLCGRSLLKSDVTNAAIYHHARNAAAFRVSKHHLPAESAALSAHGKSLCAACASKQKKAFRRPFARQQKAFFSFPSERVQKFHSPHLADLMCITPSSALKYKVRP